MILNKALLVLCVFWLYNVTSKDKKEPEQQHIELPEGKCVFPFKYKNFYFYNCVHMKNKHMWCSLNSTYEGYWKYCSKEDTAPCVFPFWYRRLIYRSCTEDGDAFGKLWCSLTKNFNKDRVWKYC